MAGLPDQMMPLTPVRGTGNQNGGDVRVKPLSSRNGALLSREAAMLVREPDRRFGGLCL
jgi:hypothetical protein